MVSGFQATEADTASSLEVDFSISVVYIYTQKDMRQYISLSIGMGVFRCDGGPRA